MIELNTIYQECCLTGLPRVPAKSVHMILCDLPYGTTQCPWDSVIPFKPLWAQYERIIKDDGAIVLTASQPFTSALVMSNPRLFRYCWVWDKVNKYTGALNANRMPLKRHEDICVFYKKIPVYNKQYRAGRTFSTTRTKGHGTHTKFGNESPGRIAVNDGNHNPCSVLQIPADNKREVGLHPTQKPVALFEYLIKTYTNPGEIVLDNCMGSGTTAIACMNTGRNFIGFEKEEKYFNLCLSRIEEHKIRQSDKSKTLTLLKDAV